jgi:predicted phosphodiesterase
LVALPKYAHKGLKDPVDPEVIRHFKWNHAQLSESSKEFLKSLGREQTIEVNGAKIFITHYPQDPDGEYHKYVGIPTIDECVELFDGHDADIYLFGHTHYLMEAHENNKYFINPGCVGCPIATHSASAGILDIDNGNISYQRIDASYDIEKVIREIEALKSELPIVEHMLRDFYRK